MKQPVAVDERSETKAEEKERLKREIALAETKEEDEELQRLRKRAASLRITEKRKRGPEASIGNSPPMVTPSKGQRLSTEAKQRIEEIRYSQSGKLDSSSLLEQVRKLSLSMKHVTAGCGPGAREQYEADCLELFEALTVDELKEACKKEKIGYGKREVAIKRLVTRRVLQAYDPINVPLPVTPSGAKRSTKTGQKPGSKALPASDISDDEDEDSESE
ncbi:hypothetical protein CBR_g22471 [Chara braunii]|uniref:Uncharacterized protein n=1 Tax=Chara braunii TaxID=69332 RepID=A0A388L2Y0_CHABU|nr:hypothetical protein CBR_g22471 [Chara braunii]|eukprot:GBG76592.1 hypothetical protein CBR_g22471 [Chara braunii]